MPYHQPIKICLCEGCDEPRRPRAKTCSRACSDALRENRPKPRPIGSAVLCASGSGKLVYREARVGRPKKFLDKETCAEWHTAEWNKKVRKTERILGTALHAAAKEPSAFVARLIEDILAIAGKRARQAQTNRILDLGVDPEGNSLSSLLHSWHTTPYLLNPDRGVVVTYACYKQNGRKAFAAAGKIEKRNKALFHDNKFKNLTGPEVINAYLMAVYGVNAFDNNKSRHFSITNKDYSDSFIDLMKENMLSPSAAKELVARQIMGTDAMKHTPNHQLQAIFPDQANSDMYGINIIKGCEHDAMSDFNKLCVKTKPANAPINEWPAFVNQKAA